jgi:iron complex transport system ATP-binding protein
MSLALQAEQLYGGYRGKDVLHGINLSVESGERVVLLGPNGSGKSTLLRALTRGLAQQRGVVRIAGTDVAHLSAMEIARRVAFVPQEEPARFPFLVEEVVAMGRIARSKGLFETEEDHRAAKAAMARADCARLAARPYTELSGGERQRVLIARALAQGTPLILLDEPTSHLDPGHQVEVAQLVGSLSAEGVTTLSAVHDLNLAHRMANRAVLLSEGRIVMDGPIEAVLEDSRLDEVYGVAFTRIATPEGQLAILPRLTS